MASGKTKALVSMGFAAALAGGVAAGMLASRYVHPPVPSTEKGEASLSAELQLSRDQQAQIRQIWEQVQKLNQSSYEDGQALNHWRDDQVVKLLNSDQQKEFEKINNEYQNRYTAMTAKRDLAFQDAVARTKRLLNEQQRQRYEQILARRMGGQVGTEPLQGSRHGGPIFSASSGSSTIASPG